MGLPPDHDQPDQDEPERHADKQANVMKDQLRKEVAVWNATRTETSAKQEAGLGVPATSRVSPRSATRQTKRSKAAEAAAAQPASVVKKPFSMSFDGVTDAEHIKYIIARGAR
jgi:hypothetical protein